MDTAGNTIETFKNPCLNRCGSTNGCDYCRPALPSYFQTKSDQLETDESRFYRQVMKTKLL